MVLDESSGVSPDRPAPNTQKPLAPQPNQPFCGTSASSRIPNVYLRVRVSPLLLLPPENVRWLEKESPVKQQRCTVETTFLLFLLAALYDIQ